MMMIITISAAIIRLFHGLHGSAEVRAAGGAVGVHKKWEPHVQGDCDEGAGQTGRQAGVRWPGWAGEGEQEVGFNWVVPNSVRGRHRPQSEVGRRTWVRALPAVGDAGTGAWSTPGVAFQGYYSPFIIFIAGKVSFPSALACLCCLPARGSAQPGCRSGRSLSAPGRENAANPHLQKRSPGENPPFLMGSGGWDAVPSPHGFWAKIPTTCL